MKQPRIAAFATALTLASAGLAEAATLTGANITATYLYPDTAMPYGGATGPSTFTVGAGVETTISVEGVTDLRIDVSANQILVTLRTVLIDPTWNAISSDVSFNGLEFVLNAGGPFGAVSSVTASNNGPVAAYLSGGSLFLNWAGMSYDDGDTVTIAFAPVPLPAGLSLLAGAFGSLVLVARRRRIA